MASAMKWLYRASLGLAGAFALVAAGIGWFYGGSPFSGTSPDGTPYLIARDGGLYEVSESVYTACLVCWYGTPLAIVAAIACDVLDRRAGRS